MKYLTIAFIIILPVLGYGQIWQETFSNASVTNGATSRTGTPGWTSVAPSGATGTTKFSKQNPASGYELFEANDTGTGTEGVWSSQVINISAYTEVALEVTLYSYFTYSTDYIRCFFKLNGGAETQFGELLGSNGLSIASAASAIVQGGTGATVQIIVRAKENTTGTNSGVDRALAFDDVTVTSISVLYSIATANWDNPNTWSKIGFSGATCSCTPDANSRVIIGNSKTVNFNNASTTAGVSVQNTGSLTWSANNQALTMARGGTITVASGGTLTKGSATGSSITYGSYIYSLVNNGTFNLDDINFNAGASVTLSGSGTMTVANLNLAIGNGRTITNAVTGSFTVSNKITYSGSNMAFVNNGVLTTTNGVTIGAGLNGNTFTNNTGATFTLSSFTANNSDFTIDNYNIINQSGDFTSVDAGSTFNNQNGATWNFGGSAIANVRLFTYGTNTFNYNRASAQTIIVPQNSYSNLTLSGSGLKTMGATTDANDGLTIAGTAQLDASTSNYTLSVGGNWTVTSTNADPFVQRSAIVTFDGTADQTILTPLSTETFYNLTVNKTTGNILIANTPGNDVTVTNILTLTSGCIDINGRTLNITNSSTAAIVRTAGFIKSEKTSSPYSQLNWSTGIATGSYVFPFGKTNAAADYIPFTFNITAAGVGVASTLSIATYPTAANNLPYPSGVTNVNRFTSDNSANLVDRFWIITPISYTTNPTATLTFTATATEVGTLTPLRAQHWTQASTKWDAPIAGQTNPTSTSARVAGVNNFSPWALSGNNAPLPIELVYFKAQSIGNDVATNWVTAQEVNNDFFTVERTTDLTTIQQVGTLKAVGNSATDQSYALVDNEPIAGLSYYRLKQTDFNGQFTYSSWVAVEFNVIASVGLVAYPNPSDGTKISFEISGLDEGSLLPIQLYDMQGRQLLNKVITPDTVGSIKDLYFDTRLTPGVYIIKAGNTLQFTSKIVVE